MSNRHEQRHLFAVPTIEASESLEPKLDTEVLYDYVQLVDLHEDLEARLIVVAEEIDKLITKHGSKYLDAIGANRIEDINPPNYVIQIIREET
jgi:hypothetical protein